MWVKQPRRQLSCSSTGSASIPSATSCLSTNGSPTPPCRWRSTIRSGLESGPGFLLPNGEELFLGATGHTAIYTPSGSTANGSWIAGPDIPNASGTPDAPGAMMPNGKILCAVSPVPTSANHFPTPTTFYEYDYTTNAFTLVSAPTGSSLNQPSYFGTMLVVPDGTVLYSNFGSQIYSYQPDGIPSRGGQAHHQHHHPKHGWFVPSRRHPTQRHLRRLRLRR